MTKDEIKEMQEHLKKHKTIEKIRKSANKHLETSSLKLGKFHLIAKEDKDDSCTCFPDDTCLDDQDHPCSS